MDYNRTGQLVSGLQAICSIATAVLLGAAISINFQVVTNGDGLNGPIDFVSNAAPTMALASLFMLGATIFSAMKFSYQYSHPESSGEVIVNFNEDASVQFPQDAEAGERTVEVNGDTASIKIEK